ncbi:MAG: GtrA family protein [Clostridia bacterium]|nr:GtrA family protein [Clostridia bacterium]
MGKLMENVKTLLKDKSRMREMALYIVFGLLTTAVNYAVYFAVTRLLGIRNMEQGSAHYKWVANAGNITGWIASVLFAFFTNKKYVFKSETDIKTGAWREFWLFVSARIASLALFDAGLFNLLLMLGMNADWDKLLMNGLVIVFNYFASKLVIFKKKE